MTDSYLIIIIFIALIHQMIFPLTLSSHDQRIAWWNHLEPHWKQVFIETLLDNQTEIGEQQLALICSSQVLRIVGPEGSYPNFTGTLQNLEGLRALTQIEYLFVTHCALQNLDGIEGHRSIKSLFVNNNQLTTISQIRYMGNLEELYISNNAIESIAPVRYCRSLHTLHCEGNRLLSLQGIDRHHEKHLRVFRCLPNTHLPQREIIRIENTYGILCR